MKKLNSFIFFGSVLFFSCNVLSKSQIKNINAFAKAANNYSNFPSEIITKRAELVLEEKLIQSIQFTPEIIKQNIAEAQKNDEVQQQLADQIDLSLQLIQQYSSLLTQLSSGDFVKDLSDNTNDLNDNLSGLVKIANTKFTNKIPTSVTTIITKMIFLVGERLTKSRQADALKEFIPIGDTLISITVKNIVEGLSNNLPGIIALDKDRFINTYTNAILANRDKRDYNSLNQYLTGINNYDNLEQLRSKCAKSATRLAVAHSKLNAAMQADTDIREIFSETQDFIVSLQDLYKTYKKLTGDKKS